MWSGILAAFCVYQLFQTLALTTTFVVLLILFNIGIAVLVFAPPEVLMLVQDFFFSSTGAISTGKLERKSVFPTSVLREWRGVEETPPKRRVIRRRVDSNVTPQLPTPQAPTLNPPPTSSPQLEIVTSSNDDYDAQTEEQHQPLEQFVHYPTPPRTPQQQQQRTPPLTPHHYQSQPPSTPPPHHQQQQYPAPAYPPSSPHTPQPPSSSSSSSSFRRIQMPPPRPHAIPSIHGPVFLPSLFPEVTVLSNNWRKVRAEARERMLNARTDGPVRPATVYHGTNNAQAIHDYRQRAEAAQAWSPAVQPGQGVDETQWLNYPLMYEGEPMTDVCPDTIALLNSVGKGRVRVAGFSWLRPRGVILKHSDDVGIAYGALTYHLGLLVPKGGTGAALTVRDTDVMEEDGKCVIFDASYVHCARNDTDGERVILYVDFKTDYKPPCITQQPRQQGLSADFLHELIEKHSSTDQQQQQQQQQKRVVGADIMAAGVMGVQPATKRN